MNDYISIVRQKRTGFDNLPISTHSASLLGAMDNLLNSYNLRAVGNRKECWEHHIELYSDV